MTVFAASLLGISTPEETPRLSAEEGYTRVTLDLRGGLPTEQRLTSRLTVVVYAPLGVAEPLLTADADALWSTSDDELTPRAAAGPETVARPCVRLLVRRGATTLAKLPLVAGIRQVLCGPEGELFELVVVSWRIPVAALRGRAAAGGSVELALRPLVRERYEGVGDVAYGGFDGGQ